MVERFELIKPRILGDATSVVWNLIQSEQLEIGGMEGKKFRMKFLSNWFLFAKEIRKVGGVDATVDYLNRVCLAYKKLYLLGYPVPPTVRYISGEKMFLLMTDLTYGGRYLLWGYNDCSSDQELEQLKLMSLSVSDVSDIWNKISIIAQKAARDTISLQGYHYHIRKHVETGEYDIVLLDIESKELFDLEGGHLASIQQANEFMILLRGSLKRLGKREKI